uniref:Uncharacterized protein n=1 Tax=Arundo donax TaxID=35708 RepID=A0A0A9AVN8_ARUDO
MISTILRCSHENDLSSSSLAILPRA